MARVAEIWMPVPGWEGFYEASSLGRVRSLERMSRVNSLMPDVKRLMGGKIRKIFTDSRGYQHINMSANGLRKCYMLHQVILLSFRGEPEPGQGCRHLDGNPSNNNIENLIWGTHLENMGDRKRHGRYAVGEDHPMSKLKREDVKDIIASPETGTALANKYNMGQSQISRIRRGKAWAEENDIP